MRRPSMYLWKWWYGPGIRRVWRALRCLPQCESTVHGRMDSLVHEGTVIEHLVRRLGRDAVIVPTNTREWFDVGYRYKGTIYYFNIKVSRGGVDNALNKKALVYTFSSLDVNAIPRQMTYNRMWRLISERPSQTTRRQYYYIYIDKRDHTVFIRGLSDIRYWVPNAVNGLQIHWGREKERQWPPWGWKQATTPQERVLNCLRQSLKSYWRDCREFVDSSPESMKTI